LVLIICLNNYLFNWNTITSTCVYTQNLNTISGCDSVVYLNLTVHPLSTSIQTISACNSFTWVNGVTYTSSNTTATHVFTNSLGCDSTVTLNLTILTNSSSIDSITSCDSYTWINVQTYTSSNTSATHILQNSVGCDSIIQLNLTIYPSYDLIETIEACGSFAWMDGQTYYNSTNTPSVSFTSVYGCDSIITLHLTIHPIYSLVDSIVSCGPYTWINGITYSSSTNIPSVFLTSANGCDSTVTLNLTIETVDLSLSESNGTLTANQSGVNHQWINCVTNVPILGETNQVFTPNIDGSYAVVLSAANCSDTSDCFDFETSNVIELNTSVSVAPNPTSSSITIKNSSIPIKTKLIDVTGKTLIDWSDDNTQQIVDLSKFQTGVYFVLIKSDFEQIIREIIKL
jgi:hypothetical protein